MVAQEFFASPDPASAGYQDGGNWVGVLFSVYNGVAAIAALALLPWLSRRLGKARTHMVCLLAGAAGYASFFLITDPQWLLLSEVASASHGPRSWPCPMRSLPAACHNPSLA
ncbi:MAG: hypothetical protein R3E03_08030 [Novosphingobium sp.]